MPSKHPNTHNKPLTIQTAKQPLARRASEGIRATARIPSLTQQTPPKPDDHSPMAIAFFATWTVYGTWLPGDKRGWFKNGRLQHPDLLVHLHSRLRMTENTVTLNPSQRQLVESTILDHCTRRNWLLHACNCRTNHVHAVVTAPGRDINIPREQFKAWCTRKLNEQSAPSHRREHWWTERGWDEFVDDPKSLETVISYIRDCQDQSRI